MAETLHRMKTEATEAIQVKTRAAKAGQLAASPAAPVGEDEPGLGVPVRTH
jgi:hypothetical protein